MVTIGKLKDYRDSSYWHLWHRAECPPCLIVETALCQAGGLRDTLAGHKAYEKFLAWKAAHGPSGRNEAYVSMSRGWALGSQGFKEDLRKEHGLAADSRAWESEGKDEIQQARWTKLFQSGCKVLGRTEADLGCRPTAQSWKIALMLFMKERTQASNPWLAERFATQAKYLSRLVSAARRQDQLPAELAQLRAKCAT